MRRHSNPRTDPVHDFSILVTLTHPPYNTRNNGGPSVRNPLPEHIDLAFRYTAEYGDGKVGDIWIKLSIKNEEGKLVDFKELVIAVSNEHDCCFLARRINPFFPAPGPATGSFNGLHAKSKFLAASPTPVPILPPSATPPSPLTSPATAPASKPPGTPCAPKSPSSSRRPPPDFHPLKNKN